MAIIADKAPNTPPLQNAKRRIVVKLTEGAETLGDAEEGSQPSKSVAKAVSALSPGLALAPYLPSLRGALRAAKGEPRKLRARTPSPVLQRYFVMEVPSDQDAEALAERTRALPEVETAYVEGGPTPPPVMPADDPRSLNQGYLDAAPNGIDARYAWDFADGTGVTFADLERGWTLAHEDLVAANITLISGTSQDFHGHGTAVLGEVVGVDNTRGGVGIAPGAHARVVSQWRNDGSYNTADAIISASLALDAGDVLLLEAQTSHPNASGYVPVEVEDAVFDAIADAVAAGIIVVEAGANGSVDLDAFTNSAGRQILNRASKDFRDSGAIMVGAGTSGTRGRSWFSNYGSRIDCFAWGDGIDTCGDGWTGTGTTTYTSSFGGTSGASPIVTGAALLLRSWAKAHALAMGPNQVRNLLSDPTLNTPSANPSSDRIGVMPDMRKVLAQAQMGRVRAQLDRWRIAAKILFGVSNDGGGVIWVPGRGPIPIDPWGPLQMEAVTPAVREMLAALAVHELAGLSDNAASLSAMRAASLAAMQRATEQLKGR